MALLQTLDAAPKECETGCQSVIDFVDINHVIQATDVPSLYIFSDHLYGIHDKGCELGRAGSASKGV
jgi:hypothetical protein